MLSKYSYEKLDPYQVPKSIRFPYDKREEKVGDSSPMKSIKDRDSSPMKQKPTLLEQQLNILGITKRIYLNFDKDMASNLFGYRHRFVKEEMKEFEGKGQPRTHKFVR